MPTYKDWIKEIDLNIDYFSAFIKAWIAFNSWYRSEYAERSDRDIIEKIKAQSNRFKGYIETFLDKNNNSQKALVFRESLYPDTNSNEVYKYAYLLLSAILKELN